MRFANFGQSTVCLRASSTRLGGAPLQFQGALTHTCERVYNVRLKISIFQAACLERPFLLWAPRTCCVFACMVACYAGSRGRLQSTQSTYVVFACMVVCHASSRGRLQSTQSMHVVLACMVVCHARSRGRLQSTHSTYVACSRGCVNTWAEPLCSWKSIAAAFGRTNVLT